MKLMPHICTIERDSSKSGLPALPLSAGWFRRFTRRMRKFYLVSDRDPRIIEYYRTTTGLMDEKRSHALSRNFYMIHPFSDVNNCREAVMAFVMLICFAVIPLELAYDPTHILDLTWKSVVLSIANVFCMVDIVLRFFTGYVEENLKVTVLKQKKVARHYVFNSYFIFDVLSSLPTDIAGYFNPDSKLVFYLHFLRILKSARVLTFLTSFDRTAFFTRWNKTLLICVRYFLMVFIVMHWATCMTSFVPQIRILIYGKRHEFSWSRHVERENLIHQYGYSLFKTLGILMCARNDQPEHFPALAREVRIRQNNRERRSMVEVAKVVNLNIFDIPPEEVLWDIVLAVIGKICMAAFAVVIITRVYEVYTLETKYQGIMNQLSEYMKNKKLPMTMRERLVQYYEHRYQKKYFKEAVISGILSENLRKEVNINVCKQLVHMVNIFSELPPTILANVLSYLKAEVYLPNDIIIKAGTIGDSMYFLASGTVAVYTPSGRRCVI
ncbi:hypothetical protein WA026_001949 [Henosepilachna vigintioctopunctata]|uniref:Cyclic nucleotide-binding domain-containing protein n=1 Tax=Henosepilachna vigintioctopunctata TaxID=420089 RepID=A0AAW1UTD9_9CUCU